MKFIGDVHGKISEYLKIIAQEKQTIQVGDFGFGFRDIPNKWSSGHLFIRGNHDSPEKCRKHPNYLGEYGVWKNIGYISGAYSVDVDYRKQDMLMGGKKCWWEDEELSRESFDKIADCIFHYKPQIMVTHDCPAEIGDQLCENSTAKRRFKNRTSDGLLQGIFDMFKPKIWIFGHYHTSWRKEIENTLFVCLDELEISEDF